MSNNSIHSPPYGHLGCLESLAVMNKAVLNLPSIMCFHCLAAEWLGLVVSVVKVPPHHDPKATGLIHHRSKSPKLSYNKPFLLVSWFISVICYSKPKLTYMVSFVHNHLHSNYWLLKVFICSGYMPFGMYDVSEKCFLPICALCFLLSFFPSSLLHCVPFFWTGDRAHGMLGKCCTTDPHATPYFPKAIFWEQKFLTLMKCSLSKFPLWLVHFSSCLKKS